VRFKSIAELQKDIVSNLHRLPDDIDIVVGIPRSGMLAASMIALMLNLPLTDIDGFAQGRTLGAGRTRRRAALDVTIDQAGTILVVDDSILSGESMNEARRKLEGLYPSKTFIFLAIYATHYHADKADMHFGMVDSPRLFEWNMMHHEMLERSMLDIDGVLCLDPSDEENDDSANYMGFLANARRLHIPTKKVGALVTSRLEKYRPQTEAWLKGAGVIYDKLIMLDLPNAQMRRKLGNHGIFKGEQYKNSPAQLFIESEAGQARTIMEMSGKPVVCLDGLSPYLISPSNLSPLTHLQNYRQGGLKKMVKAWVGHKNAARFKRLRKG
jgi:uncharacterized HAD superfamily protein/hypoxanthine phosphoribosyltransferase